MEIEDNLKKVSNGLDRIIDSINQMKERIEEEFPQKSDYKYQLIVTWSQEDDCFLVEVPELPGCMGDGKTIQEAIENTKVIISEWIAAAIADGESIPEPKGKSIA